MITHYEPVTLFLSYAHEDEPLLRKLETHLSLLKRQGLISTWHDRLLQPGSDWALEIDSRLNQASVILLLISADFLASDYCYGVEMKRALERQEMGEAQVIPILLRSVDWKAAPFARLQTLPSDAKPITAWSDEDEALTNVVTGLRRVIEDLPLLAGRSAVLAPPSHANVGMKTVKHHHGLSRGTVLLLVGLAFLVVVGGSIGVFYFTRINSQNPYPPFETLALTDALSNNSQGHGWLEFPPNSLGGACQFIGGAYHVSQSKAGYLSACKAEKSNFSNFAFEVQMRIIQGSCGGLLFRYQNINGQTFYHFKVCQDGTYAFFESFSNTLRDNTSSAAIHTGLNQSNVIAVVANNHTLDLYVNRQKVDSVNDSTHSQGVIGVVATYKAGPTEVVFSGAKVWTIGE